MSARAIPGLVYASKVLTFTGLAIADETVTIGDVTYVFKASVTTTENEVKIGSDATACATYLAEAINADTGSGTHWGSDTVVNPYVYALDGGDGSLTAICHIGGTLGNGINIDEDLTNGAWAGAATHLSGGTVREDIAIYNHLLDMRYRQQVNSQTQELLDRLIYDLGNVFLS